MAIQILKEYATEEGLHAHQPKHDLESLIYVFVWICVLYGDPRVEGNVPLEACNTCLSTWIVPKCLKQVRDLVVSIVDEP